MNRKQRRAETPEQKVANQIHVQKVADTFKVWLTANAISIVNQLFEVDETTVLRDFKLALLAASQMDAKLAEQREAQSGGGAEPQFVADAAQPDSNDVEEHSR